MTEEKPFILPSILRPEHLAPIRNLQLRARLIVEGTMAGLHKSPYHGFSAEFLEFRPYFATESTRRIDWRKYAKTEKTVVRVFEDETNLYAHLLVDTSASMGFCGSAAMNKFEYAKTLAASIAWIFIRQRDAVGLNAFDNTVHTSIAARSTNVQLKTILAKLSTMSAKGPTRCAYALDKIAHSLKRRGMCIVISDLFDNAEVIIQGLRHLHFKRQDIIVLWILDPLEMQFAFESPLEIIDVETKRNFMLEGKIARRFYEKGFQHHKKKIESACREMGIDLKIVSTDQPFQKEIMNVVQKRKRLF